MGTLTYLAKREIEPTGYTKSGTDISAAASDDSFNATSTNLSGLLDNQWVLVSGFANAANNGWFQVNGNSTSTKISQDTTTSLVTEAAGPSVTIVGYKRGLGQSYSLEFYLERAERSSKAHRTVNQPMDNVAAEVVYEHSEVFLDVVVLGPLGALITEAQMLQYREALASVLAGELFTFDRYGSIAVPVEAKQAQIESDDYVEERVAGEGALGFYKLSFTVRLLS